MKTIRTFLVALGCLCLLTAALHAQVPQIINYQGRVAVGTPPVNFNGLGLFKFALVDAAGTTTYWSSDGSSIGGGEPTGTVLIPVTNGLYSVLLGDPSLNITAIPISVFANSDVRLRVWFNDGTTGFQLLTPDQRIVAVGYAMIAGDVPDGAITNAKIANGAVGSAQIATGAVGNSQLGAGAVQSTNIAAGAVTATQIAPGTIGFASLVKPPQAGTTSGASLSFDFGQADFAVTFPQTYPVSPVVTLSLAAGSGVLLGDATVQVMAANATQFTGRLFNAFASESLTVDGVAGNVGQDTSLAVVNGKPAISYYDISNGDLKYVGAFDSDGSSWFDVTVDSTGNVGQSTSLAVVNGKPAISFNDISNGDLKYVRASDPNGTAWSAPITVDSAGFVGRYTSLAVVNGQPAISFSGSTTLKYVRAIDDSGTAWDTPVNVDATGGLYTSLRVVNGNPAISYYDAGNSNLKYVRANDSDGTSWGTPLTLASTGNVGLYTSLAVVNGNPAIGYYDATNTHAKYVRATNPEGTTWGTPITVDAAGGPFTSLTVVNGRPALSYHSGTLKYVRATDANGTAWSLPVTLDSTGAVGWSISLAVIGGSPAISYYDITKGDLKFIRQATPPSNFIINWIAIPP